MTRTRVYISKESTFFHGKKSCYTARRTSDHYMVGYEMTRDALLEWIDRAGYVVAEQ